MVLEDVTLTSGCRVSYAVLDKEVGEGAKVEGKEDALALVGAGVELEAGQKLKAGVRLEPEHRESG